MASSPVSTNYTQDGAESTYTNRNRRSKLFFGICDMRTATVVVNILNIIFTLVVGLIMTIMFAFENGPYKGNHILSIILEAVGVSAISALGLYSAMNWRLNGMIVSTVAFVAILAFHLIKFEWIDFLVTALILYPQIVFTMEMRSGVMSPETFETEEYVAEGGRDFVEMANHYISPNSTMLSQ
mmetsp:Transcript_6196/g.15374  ORF Transcript_6196/g.15374 Transcript_6196/m.15374 type:complete len:183 (+) Transcript_6196:195-743(+)